MGRFRPCSRGRFRGYPWRMPTNDSLADAMPCPSCGRSLPTRVLADSVTLITVGVCPVDGTSELARVVLAAADPYPVEDPAGAEEGALVAAPRAYKPGAECGLRLGLHAWCRLPVGHAEPHAG